MSTIYRAHFAQSNRFAKLFNQKKKKETPKEPVVYCIFFFEQVVTVIYMVVNNQQDTLFKAWAPQTGDNARESW